MNRGEFNPAPPPPTPSGVSTIGRYKGDLVPSWLTPGLLSLLAAQTVAGRVRDPARPVRPVLDLAGRIPASSASQTVQAPVVPLPTPGAA